MKYYHFHNDISLEISLRSVTTDLTIDASMIKSIQFFTRKNGATYKCCFGNNTLINNGDTVTAVLNNHCLEPGVLQYIVEFQIPDSTYPDYYKKIHQYYATEIELVKGNGETEIADVQAMFGSTIDGKFNDLEAEIDDVSEDVEEISASIVSIQELNSIQDASINRIEDIISTIDGGTSGSIDRLDTSVNALQSDVSALNSSVSTLTTEQETMSQNLSNVTNTVNDVSTRVDGFESALANKADVSVLSNYYTTGETYTKTEVDAAIASAALDGSLPAGVVVDANYVHTDNNYTTEDKNKVRDFDLTGYPTNSSLVANYATKTELQNVDNNHPTNASVNATYLKKSDLAGELTDYPTNSSVVANYAKKNDISTFVNMADVSFWVTEEGFITGNDVSQFVTDDFVNLNYVSWENLDEAVFNMIDNNYDVQWKVQEIVNDSSTISDISTNVSDVSIKVDDVSVKVKDVSLVSLDISTRLNNDYLTAQIINRDFVKNASLNDYVLNSSLSANYTTKSEFNEVWETFVTADQVDETYAKIIDVSNHLTTNDISTFKPIVFCTQAEYDTLVSNNNVDANTVYMINGQPVTYLTANDVSIYATKEEVSNDISTFITSNDVSIYATTAYVNQQLGNIQNILSTI